MKTIYSYLRFSTPRQQWGDSERRQESLAKDWCSKHNLILSDKTFADRGISGWKGANQKKALGELLGIIQAGDMLLVEDLDRLSRQDALSAMNFLQGIVTKGVTIISLRDGQSITQENFLSLPTFLPNVLKASLAYEENQKKSSRIRESWKGRREKMKKGFIGGKKPFWIQATSNESLSIMEDRAKVIRSIFDMAYRGMGMRTIMHRLAKDKIPSFRKNLHWSKGGISYLLKNMAVYGAIQPYTFENKKRIPVDEIIDGYYPAIISKEKFLAVQHKIAKRMMYGGGKVTDNISNLLTGICKCSHCGGNIIITHKGCKEISYLACSAYHWHKRCAKAVVNYIQVEKSLLDYIAKDTKAIQYFSPDNTIQKLQQSMDEKEAAVDDLEKTIIKLTDLIERTDAPEPLVTRLKERISERDKLKVAVHSLIAERYALENKVSLTSVVQGLTAKLQSAGINVTVAPNVIKKLGMDKPQPVISQDRLLIREALRNSVKSMKLDLGAKTMTIVWNSDATSIIEMKFKRQGQKNAIYLYRTKTNDNIMSDWLNLGSIMAESAQT